MDIDNIEVVRMGEFPQATKANCKSSSPGTTTPTNLSPVITPRTTSPDYQLNKQATDPKFIDQYVGQRLMEEKTKTNTYASHSTMSANAGGVRPPGAHRHFYNGLDTIPEYDVTHTPITFQPLVPPPVPVAKVATTTYNISFPRPLQLRDSFESWRGGQGLYHPFQSNASSSARYSSGTGSSCSSSVPHSPGSSVTSPFHDAKAANPVDVSEFHPLNVIESDTKTLKSSASSSGYSSSSRSSSSSTADHKPKASKRSRTNSPNRDDHYDLSDGASSRQRRKSSSSGGGDKSTTTTSTSSSETKRRDSIKNGLEELQRVLPQFGSPEEEKISQATILSEAAKYLKSLKEAQDDGATSLESTQRDIEELNKQIERLQNHLPDNGAVFAMDKNNLVAVKRSLPEQFSDHVVEKTHANWKYWVFTSIMGHFVHSFNQEVSSASQHDLQTTSLEWITNSMSLQQLRKDVSRKLAKLNAKTSISDDPSKLPEEARKFVSSSKRLHGGLRR